MLSPVMRGILCSWMNTSTRVGGCVFLSLSFAGDLSEVTARIAAVLDGQPFLGACVRIRLEMNTCRGSYFFVMALPLELFVFEVFSIVRKSRSIIEFASIRPQ